MQVFCHAREINVNRQGCDWPPTALVRSVFTERIRNPQSPIRNRVGAPAGIRTPNQQIMRRFEGHQQGETKQDNPVFTESAAVKVS